MRIVRYRFFISSSHLKSTNCSHLDSPLLNSARVLPPLLNSSHFVSTGWTFLISAQRCCILFTSSRNHLNRQLPELFFHELNPCDLFPASLCGVLVFGSVSRPSPPPPPPPPPHATLSHTHNLSHTTFFTHNFVTHTHTHAIFHMQPPGHTHTQSFTHAVFFTQLCHTHNLPHTIFHTHTMTTLSHATLSHRIFHTQLCHTTLSHTHNLCHTRNFVTQNLSHTSLSHNTTLSHTHNLSHTTLSHTHNFGTLRGRRGAWKHPRSFCVADVALGDIHVPFAWQTWPLATSTFLLRGRRGPYRRHPRSFCVADVALGDIHVPFAWQTWPLATSTFLLRGRRGSWRHPRSFCVAGVALGDTHAAIVWQAWLWWRAWSALVTRGAAALCVVGVVLGDIHGPFAWQEWHLATATVLLTKKNIIFLDSLEGGLFFFSKFFWFWSLSAICTFLYTGRWVSSWVQACRNQSFNHCSYELLGLRIKTVCSNVEMFGHILDHSLSFMLDFFFQKHVA